MDDAVSFEQHLLAASDEILLLIDGDTLCILAANPAALRQLGYSEAEFIGQSIGEFECALSDMFFWDEMRGREWMVNVESSLRCADGRVLEVAKSVKRISTAPSRFTVRALPVAGHNRIEAELAAMGSRLRATLEATADGILLVDREGAIINMNQRFSSMWNLPESMLVNRDDAGIMAFIAAALAAEVDSSDTDQPPMEDEEDANVETQYLRDGRVFERRAHHAHSGQEVIGRVFSYRDVTERYRTQRELIFARDQAHRASRAKGEFLAMMSHEIRTPMNGVLGIAELLAGTPLNEEQADYLRIIRSSGGTLMAIINDILDYSKIEAGKLSLERTDFSLVDLLEELTALFRLRQQPGGPEFSCAVDGTVAARLTGDQVRLRQILFNLIGNAFKFTERGSIELHVAPVPGDGQMLRFAVRDSGIGLTPEQQGRLFKSFEQADSSTTRKYGGTGLGLAICKSLAELMGGAIGVISQAGSGSEFWFTARLPAAVTVAAATSAASVTAGVLTSTTRILLVEDNLVNRKVMAGMITRLGGGEVTVAINGQEAVDATKRAQFDVILMDTQMPVMDGLTATRLIRKAGDTTPIIGVSAGALDEERAEALAAGVDAYVLKPVNLSVLAAALGSLLHASPTSPALP